MSDSAAQTMKSNEEKPPETERAERTPKFSDYIRVFGYATKWDVCVYIIASVASIGGGATMPLMNLVFGRLVGQFTEFYSDSGNFGPQDLERMQNQVALYITGLFIARWGLNAINQFCFRMIGIRLSSAIRLHYLQSLLAQPIHVIDSMPAGAPATAITATSNTLQLGISERLGTLVEFLSTIVSALIVAFIWSWDITLVTSSMLVYSVIVLSICLPLILKGFNAFTKADAQATAIASEALEGIRLVSACGAQSRVVSRYTEWAEKAMSHTQKMAPVVGSELGLLYFGVFGAFGLSFWYGTQRFIAGVLSNAGAVMVVLMSVMLIFTSMERISTPIMSINKAIVSACELLTVIDMPAPESGSLTPDITSEELVFEDVVFEYPSRPGVRVLDGLSFRIQPGKNTALVGQSGSGKSTIVALLERWYSLKEQHVIPQVVQPKPASTSGDETDDQKSDEKPKPVSKPTLSGTIRAGNNNLEDLDLKWWRAQIGLVQQEPFLFNDTIFGNVAHGLIGSPWEHETEERKLELVKEACKESYADEFIDRLPDGYNTRVGDGGAKLSGGQKQRLAIARSIIKKPQIIILDEATSAIDVKSEKLVQAALDGITKDRTTITIAHRLSTIKKADHIIVLQKGRAVEEGSHDSLVANESGAYSALVRAQSLSFSPAVAQQSAPASEADVKKSLDTTTEVAVELDRPGTSPQDAAAKRSRSLLRIFGALLLRQRAQWPFFMAIFLSALGSAAGMPLQAWLMAKAIGVFTLTGTDNLKREGNFWGLMWLFLALGVGISYLLQGWISIHIQYFASAKLKVQYLNDMLHQKLSFFDEDSNAAAGLSARIVSDVRKIEELFGINIAFIISSVFTIIGCITISLVFGWKLGLVALGVTMPVMVACGFWKWRYEMQFDEMNSAVFSESSQFAAEAIGAIRTVAALTMESSINTRYQTLLNGHVQAARLKAQWTAGLLGFADSATLGCQALIIWYGGKLMASGEYSFEAFFVCYMAAISGVGGASQTVALAPSAVQAAAAAHRMLDLHEDEVHRSEGKAGVDIPEADGGVKIELRNVQFKYPTRDMTVFEDLSLSIEKGQYAAFVGPSGCGKTTIVSLIERFYDVEQNKGSILCNGVNINSLDVYDYRKNLSLVSQEPILFRGTVRDNVLFGIEDPSSVSEERIQQVCRDAYIHDFIISLPEGYDTEVGQKGLSMSGGQKQRIAIARALIRDPKILLLDEATSALDSESEKIVQAAFERARSGRTMIAVAHRLSTIQNADVIFVFDQGRVVEKGTHAELIGKQGVYWDMCKSQALDR